MSPTEKREAEAWMLHRMQAGEFSFSQLHTECSAALGSNDAYYRLADRTIQKQRVAGNIRLNNTRRWKWVNVT